MINKKTVGLALLAIVIIIQFFGVSKEVPEVVPGQDFLQITNPPLEIAELVKSTCYDCHSYETKYPWYTNIAPLSWWIGHHIEEGREHLNFSVWSTYSEKKALHKLEEFYEEVEEGEMPLSSYTIVHAEASLSDKQTNELVNWVKSLPGVVN